MTTVEAVLVVGVLGPTVLFTASLLRLLFATVWTMGRTWWASVRRRPHVLLTFDPVEGSPVPVPPPPPRPEGLDEQTATLISQLLSQVGQEDVARYVVQGWSVSLARARVWVAWTSQFGGGL